MCVFNLYAFKYTTYMQYLRQPEEGVRSLGAGVTAGFELPCGCCEPSPDLSKSSQCF